MKIRVTMKDPDTLCDAIDEVVRKDVASIADPVERDAVADLRTVKARTVAARWFEWSEYLTAEIDAEAGTISVVPRA